VRTSDFVSEIQTARSWLAGDRHVETTMLRLKRSQRAVVVEKLPDLANLVAGVLGLGQFVGDEPASVSRMIVGAALWTGLAGVTLLIAGGES
jgi:hypothetical protein